jgi:hypothetical protein
VNILDFKFSFFKITMMSNALWAIDHPMDILWMLIQCPDFGRNILQCIAMCLTF